MYQTVSKVTYTVSSEALNPSIPYHTTCIKLGDPHFNTSFDLPCTLKDVQTNKNKTDRRSLYRNTHVPFGERGQQYGLHGRHW